MKLAIFILLMFPFCNTTFGQIDGCSMGTASAKADYSKGILRIYVFGLTDSFTFGRILKEDYGIEVLYQGCMVDERLGCYSTFMIEKLKQRFGDDLIKKAIIKSKQLDSLGKGDRQSIFPGGSTELVKFVYCNLDLIKTKYSVHKKAKVFLRFAIDTTGRPVDISVMKTPNEDYSKEAIRLVSIMPNWIPATKNGTRIQQIWNLPIAFDNYEKEKYCP